PNGAATLLRGHSGPISQLIFPADGKSLVSLSNDRTVRIWNFTTGASRGFEHTSDVSGIAVSQFNVVACGTTDGVIHVWSILSGDHWQLAGHVGRTNQVAFSPTGTFIASAGEDKTVRVWSTPRSESRVLRGHQDAVLEALFAPSGAWVATGS